MSALDEIEKAITDGDAARTADLVVALDDDARRALGKELPELLRSRPDLPGFGLVRQRVVEALLIAGAGTIAGPAAAAGWLRRRDLAFWWRPEDTSTEFRARLCAATAARPDAWRAEVGHRLGDRLRVAGVDRSHWGMAAALVASAGAAPPVSDGFVVGWVSGPTPGAESLAADPFLDVLVPRLFEADGVGAALAEDDVTSQADVAPRSSHWGGALAALAHAGRLDRAALVDGCVGRFLRGGTARDLRWFVRLHDALEPTADESAARVRDYVQLLPAAPSTVADLALREVRRVDDLGLLDAALFDDAAGALLFRPEKKLVRAAITWLDRTARDRDRVDATLRALSAVFASDALDLRERAVKSAVKHAGRAGEEVRAEVRDAAAGLPADLREPIAAAFGEVEGADAGPEPPIGPPPIGPPPFVPRAAPVPIGSIAELADEFAVLARSRPSWIAKERFVGAAVEFAYLDLDATREALISAMLCFPR